MPEKCKLTSWTADLHLHVTHPHLLRAHFEYPRLRGRQDGVLHPWPRDGHQTRW